MGKSSQSTAAESAAVGAAVGFSDDSPPDPRADLLALVRRHWPEIDADAAAGEMLQILENARHRPRKPR